MNISSRLLDIKTTTNFHNKTHKNIINYNFENTEFNRNKALKRPSSTMNIGLQKNCPNNYHSKVGNKFPNDYKKIPFSNLNDLDLDSLYEKQLQKLREINKNEEEEFNKKYNSNSYIKDIDEEKKNEDIKNIKSFNEKTFGNNNNQIKNIKTIQPRPISNYGKKRNSNLPKIETTSPINRNIFIKRIFSNRNFQEKKIQFKKLVPVLRPITSKKTTLHREYGKIPKYLEEMKLKAKLKKDLEKKLEEEKYYPKGTRLLSEEERIFTLKKLKESKKDLEILITKLPITLDSLGAKNKQNKLYKELDEIEQAINTFSKNKVFVKIDS